MKEDKNILKHKSLQFAIRVVNLYKYLIEFKKELVISRQILKSGTSNGANCREADYAVSKIDFIHKIAIAQKECNETIYWLELLYSTNFISEKEYNSINNDAIEIMKLLTSIIISAKKSLTKKND
jgi:four helix bundle protein